MWVCLFADWFGSWWHWSYSTKCHSQAHRNAGSSLQHIFWNIRAVLRYQPVLTSQVEYNTELENRLPAFVLRRVNKSQLVIHPNCRRFHLMMVSHLNNNESFAQHCCRCVWRVVVVEPNDGPEGSESQCDDGVDRWRCEQRRERGWDGAPESHVRGDASTASQVSLSPSLPNCIHSLSNLIASSLERLRQISSDLAKQYELLRLIVTKMEIRTEQEDYDDVTSAHEDAPKTSRLNRSIGWSSRTLRHDLLKQSMVVAKWSQSSLDSKKWRNMWLRVKLIPVVLRAYSRYFL